MTIDTDISSPPLPGAGNAINGGRVLLSYQPEEEKPRNDNMLGRVTVDSLYTANR